MGFELGRAFRNCLLEGKGRREVLCALIAQCNDETGYVWIDRHDLALQARLSVMRAARLVRDLSKDPDLEGLVTVRDDLGRRNEIVCHLAIVRLWPLRPAAHFDRRLDWLSGYEMGVKASPDHLASRAARILDLGGMA